MEGVRLMAEPIKLLRMHCTPQTGRIDGPKRTQLYVCHEPVPGFHARSGRDGMDFTLPVVFDGLGFDTTDAVAATTATRVVIAKASGGAIWEWFHSSDTNPATGVQIVNHFDKTGRHIQYAAFLNVDNQGTVNPTQAGGYYSGVEVGLIPDGKRPSQAYSVDDVVMGSPMTDYAILDHGNGSKTIRCLARPLDYEGDSRRPDVELHGFTGHDAFIYPFIRQGFDLTLNVGGYDGIHRYDGWFRSEQKLGPGHNSHLDHATFFLRHGFDKLYIWNENNTDGILLNEELIYAGLDEATVSWTLAGNTITLSLTGHGRAVGTEHLITIAASGNAEVDGTWRFVFTDADTAVSQTGPDGDDSGTASITSPDAYFYSRDDNNIRQIWAGRTHIGGGTLIDAVDDIQGHYLGKSPIAEPGMHALIFRADGTEAWSIADGVESVDFCVAIYGFVDTLKQSTRFLSYQNSTQAAGLGPHGPPSNDPTTYHYQLGAFSEGLFGPDLVIKSGEWRGHTTFVVMGTFAEVKTRLAILASLIAGASATHGSVGTQPPHIPPGQSSTGSGTVGVSSVGGPSGFGLIESGTPGIVTTEEPAPPVEVLGG
jgi:hypothetical protein